MPQTSPMPHQPKFNLTHYASFAAAVLAGMGNGKAEVVYTDIDPDIVLDANNGYYTIDIDGNGEMDFSFGLGTDYINTYFTFYFYLQEIVANPFDENAIAGNSQFYPYPAGLTYFFPYALELNDVISTDLLWQPNPPQFLAWKTWTDEYDGHCFNCYWNLYQEPDVLDHFLGLRLMDADSNYRYGWLRCDVKEDGSILVLKDFAYETEADYKILAGSKTTFEEIKPGTIVGEIYASGNVIHLVITRRPTDEYIVNVFNVSGQNVYTASNNSPFMEIELDVPKGTYLCVVTSGAITFSKLVYVD